MKNPWFLGIIGFFLILVMASYTLFLERQSALEHSRLTLTGALDRMEKDLTRSLAGMEQMFLGFQHYLELMEQRPEPDLSNLRRVMDTLVLNNPYMVSVLATDAEGQVLHWTNSGPKPNLRERDYFRIHTTAMIEEMVIGAPLPSIMSPGQWIFGTSKAVRHPDGTINKVLIAIIDTNRMFRRFEVLRPDPQTVLTVLSPTGAIYTRVPDHFEMAGQNRPELLNLIQPSTERRNWSDIVTIDGKKHLILLRQLECCQIIIRGETPLAHVLIPWQKKVLVISATAGLIALILVWQLRTLIHYRKQQEELQQQIQVEAQRDPLTGLPLWSPQLKTGNTIRDLEYPTALLMIGLDQFSQLSESLEEQAIADLLTQCVRILKRFRTGSAQLSRSSSGNFLLLLPGADRQQGLAIADKLRTTLATEVTVPGRTETGLTASIGVTLWDLGETELAAACKRATSALATARARGGDQTCWQAARENWLERNLS